MDERGDRVAEVERGLVGELERDDAELAQIRATLERLRELRRRIDEGRLEPDDRALLRALIEQEILERM
jgi:anti-sigma28 factor (negative regulator of flagellin synthesis)